MRWIRISSALMVLLLGSFAPVAAAGPTLAVVAPKDGEYIVGNSVTVSFTTSGITLVPTSIPVSEAGKHPEANRPGQGHLHFVLDLQPLVVWEQAAPYVFNDIPPGDHQLMVELVQNDHSSLSPPVMRQLHFRSGAMAMLPTTGADAISALPVAPIWLLLIGSLLVAGGFLLRRRREI